MNYIRYTNLEYQGGLLGGSYSLHIDDHKGMKVYRLGYGDGTRMLFRTNSFDTVITCQVSEHVFGPLAMMNEI